MSGETPESQGVDSSYSIARAGTETSFDFVTRRIREVHGVDRVMFERDILPAGEPVLMKGLVADWPAVKAARQSSESIGVYLKAHDITNQKANVSVIQPMHKGRFFYTPDMQNMNFMVDQRAVSAVIDWLVANRDRDDVVTTYVQALVLEQYMPKFEDENPLDILGRSYGPRMWLGNRVRTQTHFDPSHNIACLVAGRRRFTLFPPDQIANLYPAPFDNTPGGVPVSIASLEEPDFERFPRFREALKTAQYADLEPGDALFVPYAWWHHVQSGSGFNVLVNYWWNDVQEGWVSPLMAFYASILTLRDLPPEQKAVWRNILDLYVFGDNEASVAHIPPDARSTFGPMTPAVRQTLLGMLKMGLRL